MEARDTKLEPDLQPIRTLKEVDMICHLWQQYTNVALLPLANTSVTLRREMSIFNNQTLSRVEGGANGMLQRVADCAYPPPCLSMPASASLMNIPVRQPLSHGYRLY